jgi:hypothetical protein
MNPNFSKSSTNSSSGIYSGVNGVFKLGNYTNNNSDIQTTQQKEKNRDIVLNTLINGSYIPNDIKKCTELLTTDKKNGIKTKSEK